MLNDIVMENVRSLSVLFSQECNMKCKYCYLPKTEHSSHVNKILIEKIKDGSIIQDFKDSVNPDFITNIGLWGAEPTINSNISEKFFDELFVYFPKIEDIMFSTNALLGTKSIIKIVENIENGLVKNDYPRKIVIDIQISLDGPAWITDSNRHENATKKIVQTYNEVVKEINNMTFNKIKGVNMSFKPTLTCDNMKKMNENNELLVGWYKFFDDIAEGIKPFVDKDKNIKRPSLAYPTIVTPGEHTSEDGKQFAQWIKNIRKMENDNLKNYQDKDRLITFQTTEKFERFLIQNEEMPRRAREYTCGGGDSAFAVSYDGTIHLCHRNYAVNAFEQIPDEYYAMKTLIAKTDSDKDMARLIYIGRGYHDFIHMRFQFVIATLKTLALCGQVDKIYLEDDNFCMLFAMMVNGITCQAGNAELTASMHLTVLSLIRLFGNGAFQELLDISLERLVGKEE